MKETLPIISIGLYLIVGIISLVMAVKCFVTKKFLPFHEEASGKKWQEMDKPLQQVILALTKVSGLGFLVTAILLIVFPFVNYFRGDSFVKFAIPLISFGFCAQLFMVNFNLHKESKAKTPWKGSLLAMLIILIAFFISIL